MADEKKKLSTADILAQARAQAAGGSGESDSSQEEQAEETASAPESPSTDAPQSTSDILAAARAQASGGDDAPAQSGEEKTPAKSGGGDAPKGTSDILAAARAQAAGGDKPAAGGAAPKGTSDILAAARAQAGQGGGESKPAAGKPAAKSKTAAKPVGDLPPVKDMVEAMKSGKKAEEVKSGPARPKIPTRPPKSPKPAAKTPQGESRRNALLAILVSPFALAWTVLAAVGGLSTLYVARFMMPNVLVEPPSKFKIGPPTDYGFGTVATKWKAQYGVWVVNTEYNGRKMIYALASVCTHLGCTPNWLGGEQKFKCPCHGSGFYITGINFEGPAPRPLERVGIALGSDGMLEVDKSVKFQEELGQWNDSASFVEV